MDGSSLLDAYCETGIVHLPATLPEDVLAPLRAAATGPYNAPLADLTLLASTDLPQLASTLAGMPFECRLEHCWLRRRYAPQHAPRGYHPNLWHQDGGLGVTFSANPQDVPPMTRLLTLWIPLTACGERSPGLEFIRCPLERLLHYTELNDANLRRSFPADAFWTPQLAAGDALFFHPGILHRTHVLATMTEDRLSVEYRFFPPAEPPVLPSP